MPISLQPYHFELLVNLTRMIICIVGLLICSSMVIPMGELGKPWAKLSLAFMAFLFASFYYLLEVIWLLPYGLYIRGVANIFGYAVITHSVYQVSKSYKEMFKKI